MWLYWPQKCPLEELCVEKPKCCVVVDAAVAAGTTVCTVGNTDSFVRSLAPVGLVNRQQQPVDQEVELVKQPAESVPVTGATERYYQVQGRGAGCWGWIGKWVWWSTAAAPGFCTLMAGLA